MKHTIYSITYYVIYVIYFNIVFENRILQKKDICQHKTLSWQYNFLFILETLL